MSACIPMVLRVNPIEFDGINKQEGLNPAERLQKLNQVAIHQMALLLENHAKKWMEIKR